MHYSVTKTYGHDLGLSCAFRQWRANSHCAQLHGYALGFSIVFACDVLDQKNWVVDFGGLKDLKKAIKDTFDHKTVVAEDDPSLELYRRMSDEFMVNLVVMDKVGAEAFAEHVFRLAEAFVSEMGAHATEVRGLRVVSVTCMEHGANSATIHG